jgi:hypothetical protein
MLLKIYDQPNESIKDFKVSDIDRRKMLRKIKEFIITVKMGYRFHLVR